MYIFTNKFTNIDQISIYVARDPNRVSHPYYISSIDHESIL